ncbi:MAG: MgtC/SapB family protein [Caulobacterales bacterium]|nr:MgtC/SapB family protein [Caulobacterales bacterium]
MPLELFQRLGLALAVGLLIGVERGWHARDVPEGGRTAGVRTYALSGLLGGVAGVLGQTLGGWAFASVALPFATAFILFKHREQMAGKDYSVTAVVAALLVFALGAWAIVGDGRVVAAVAVVAVGLLAFKEALHRWLERLTWPELRSALILLAMSLVALPLLPNQGYGPHGAFNPYELWLLTIAMAGVSFAGYVAIRVFGASRGLLLASVAGAMVSSTAVTFHLARREKAAPNTLAHAGAALAAGAVMAARLCVIAAILSPVLLPRLLPPLAAFAIVSAALALAAIWRAARNGKGEAGSPMKSPFDLDVVFKFALALGLVMAAARVLAGTWGAAGLLPFSALAGLADVDAVALTTARMTTQGLDPRLGAWAILLAAGADSGSKAVIAAVVGGPRLGALFAAGTLLAAAGGAAAYWALGLW